MKHSLVTAISIITLFAQGCVEPVVQNSNLMPDVANIQPQIEPSDHEQKRDPYWLQSFDIDGDGKKDNIDFEFSRGAHCCYKIEITLSKSKKTVKFPFEMDGGYVGGSIDNRHPWHFDIRDIDNDGLPEILMRIETYSYHVYPIPKKWQKRYGFKTNFIVIEYEKGKLKVRDQKKSEKTENI
jgi:hypothetical protein